MKDILPRWIAQWLELAFVPNGDRITWEVHTAWKLSPWATLLLIVIAVSYTLSLYLREAALTQRTYRALLMTLRLIAIALLLIMLAQWVVIIRVSGRPAIAIALDHSASMGVSSSSIPDADTEGDVAHSQPGEPTRLDDAKRLLTGNGDGLIRRLAKRYDVKLYRVGASVQAIDPRDETIQAIEETSSSAASSYASRLGDAVVEILSDFRGTPPAAIVLFSDGITTAGRPLDEAARHAGSKGVPLFCVGMGSDQLPPDIELADVLVEDTVFLHDPVSFQIQLKSSGLSGIPVTVSLRREGEVVATEEVALPVGDGSATAQLIHRPSTPGEHTYRIEVQALDGEARRDNNDREVVVEVRDLKVRVLLAFGYPSYEFRYLKTLLERTPSVELASFLQDADPQHAEQDRTALRTFPISSEELAEYDVVVIGDLDPRLLPRDAWQYLSDQVSKGGGGVAFIAGPRYFERYYAGNPRIATMLPVEVAGTGRVSNSQARSPESGFQVSPTPLGLRFPGMQLGDTQTETERIWDKLAPLYWHLAVAKVKPAAQVLAEAGTSPAICYQYFGAGRVLFHAMDSTWRWRLGIGDTYFARYWVQTIRYLARGKLKRGDAARLTINRTEFRAGETANVRLRMFGSGQAERDSDVTVLIRGEGQQRQVVDLRRVPLAHGVFDGQVTDLQPGSYEAVLTSPQLTEPPVARFKVASPPGEFARLQMDSTILNQAANLSGGRYFTPANAQELLDHLPDGHRPLVKQLPPVPIWNRWWLLSAFLVALTAEWILRRRKGLL